MVWCPFYFIRGEMMKDLREQLKEWKKVHKFDEKLSDWELKELKELKELMGVNRPTYKRGKGGAMRQK